eukprot:337759-Pelagomonas_calceolata.AAC.3
MQMPGSKKPNQPGPSEDEEIGALGYGAIAAGAVANPITLWSAYTLKVGVWTALEEWRKGGGLAELDCCWHACNATTGVAAGSYAA